ncbi:MAG: hypothetical protein AUI11_08775 [Acidobacteria bacterium 13_2_20CM_2_66_4]|nr:MAG: hypothetical protein AUI11_08775 [Acidobacteria bacterium 13_2_20CM_2_66_4]PYQ71824.1 MAG: hypothetical protein DMG01_25110 [Acidobacteriota bacterium]
MFRMIATKIARSIGILCAVVVCALPKAASAQSTTTTVPFSTSILNTCTNELVDINGLQTITSNFKFDNAGGLHINFGIVSKGAGVGQVTTTNYPFSENDLFNVQATSGAGEFTIRIKMRMRGPGSIDNWDMIQMLRMTITANGDVTSSIDSTTTNCRG